MASAEGLVISVQSVEEWKDHIQKAIESSKLVVVDFSATWCGPCRFIAPTVAEFAKKFPHIIFLKVDVDDLKSIAEEYTVEAFPTFVFLKEGKEIDRFVGARKDELETKIAKHDS